MKFEEMRKGMLEALSTLAEGAPETALALCNHYEREAPDTTNPTELNRCAGLFYSVRGLCNLALQDWSQAITDLAEAERFTSEMSFAERESPTVRPFVQVTAGYAYMMLALQSDQWHVEGLRQKTLNNADLALDRGSVQCSLVPHIDVMAAWQVRAKILQAQVSHFMDDPNRIQVRLHLAQRAQRMPAIQRDDMSGARMLCDWFAQEDIPLGTPISTVAEPWKADIELHVRWLARILSLPRHS